LWRFHKSKLDSETECWRLLADAGEEISFGQVFLQWRNDERFRAFWSASLREVAFDSYCWECPPVTSQNLQQAFECVFVSSPLLSGMPPDPSPFAEYFRPDCSVVTFESLGRDALLVAPCPGTQGGNFAHLARFVATASDEYKSALWKGVGEALEKRLGASPTWLSTAGLGVPWLHVRLDTLPKYYRHAPYRQRLR
jgi:uncharacterized protein DUF6940